MSSRLPTASDEVCTALRRSIEAAITGAVVDVTSRSPGHFEIRVVSRAFEGKSMLQQQQVVYGAIAHLMRGDDAPVHAIDRLHTAIE